ncbi:MAG: hypothetical protein AB1750_06070 [Chloroflexota bacterium]
MCGQSLQTLEIATENIVYSTEKDKAYYQEGIEQVEPYLLSKELYYPISARTTDLTQLTLGGLLLTRARLGRTPGLGALDSRLDSVRAKWRSAWDAKARREVRARSELWKDYLSEVRHDRRGAARQYSQNVRHRVIIALLGETSDLMDNYVRSILVPGAFVWDGSLQGNFPPPDFWFLYGSLSLEEKA